MTVKDVVAILPRYVAVTVYELGMVADTELPVTVVPGAVKVVAEVTSPKLFPNMSNASAE